MALYVPLVKMTQQGVVNLKDHPSVYAEWSKYGGSIGAKVVNAVGCLGEYDYVVLVDYPAQKAALKGAGFAAEPGMVQTQTLPALPVEEFFEVMADLPA